jgi:hypothetical protein
MATYSQSRSSDEPDTDNEIELLVTIQLGENEATVSRITEHRSRHEGLGGYPPPKPQPKPKVIDNGSGMCKAGCSFVRVLDFDGAAYAGFTVPNGSSVTIEVL